jgi:hypothetical protein
MLLLCITALQVVTSRTNPALGAQLPAALPQPSSGVGARPGAARPDQRSGGSIGGSSRTEQPSSRRLQQGDVQTDLAILRLQSGLGDLAAVGDNILASVLAGGPAAEAPAPETTPLLPAAPSALPPPTDAGGRGPEEGRLPCL